MVKIFIWGTGKRSNDYINKGFYGNCEIMAFIQTAAAESEYRSIPVISPIEAKEQIDSVDYVVINNQFFWEIFGTCNLVGIPADKLVITDNIEEPPFDQLFRRLKDVSPALYEHVKNLSFRVIKANEMDHVDSDRLVGKDRYGNLEYRNEYVRFRTFELAAREIKEYKIEGAMAELGVFNGTFSCLINAHFPDRKLYLFDTFEGFDAKEAEDELAKGRCEESFIEDHKNSSIHRLTENLPHFENCIVCKGFFPDTITDEARKERYAFVSLDVDFEESTYQGLKFFYPRLSSGGYIFLHDYNTFFLEGVKIAVQRFEKEIGFSLKKVPIADRAGTLIIVK